MDANSLDNLEGLKIVSFESRRAKEMAELIRRHGGDAITAPSMREVPLSENKIPLDLFRRLEAGKVDWVILLTGVGTRTLVDALANFYSREKIAAVLSRVPILARGPKPVAALKELGLQPTLTAPEPNTWKEILGLLDRHSPLQGKRIAVQEYGVTNPELLAGLETRGVEILRVPVYRWALPADIAPLKASLRLIAAAQVDVVVFTSATQVQNVFNVAEQDGLGAALPGALGKLLVVSIGPVCSAALAQFHLKADFEPAHPKMGFMIGALSPVAKRLLNAKRQRS